MIQTGLRGVLAFALLCATAKGAYAIDSASLEFASGNKTQLLRAGLQWNWYESWEVSKSAKLSGFWDLSFAYWQGDHHKDVDGLSQDIYAAGFTPVLRLISKSGIGAYVEAGIGPHLLSDRYDINRRQLSTQFQFGSHLGLGYVLSNGLDIAVRYQHYSNASIKQPNDGVNFTILRVSYPL